MNSSEAPSYVSTTDAEPFEFYEALRAKGDVHWDEGMRAWLVTSYEACRDVGRVDDSDFFMPERLAERGAGIVGKLFGGDRVIEQLEGEDHLKMHNWWLRSFSPSKMAAWRADLIRPLVDITIDRFVERGSAELVGEFAQRIPVRAIAAILGLPWQDDDWIDECKKLNETAISFRVRRIGLGKDGAEEGNRALLEESIDASRRLNEILMPIVMARKEGSGDDFISMSWREGANVLDNWSAEDVLANTRFMFLAGSDTTQHAMANMTYLLATRPDLREEIRTGGEAKARNFVEESLRLFGTVHFRSRQALSDTAISGCPVAKGDFVMPLMAAANRDPAHYPRPNEVDLARVNPRDHISFYFGIRSCAGAALARAEMLEAAMAIVERLPTLRLDPDVEAPAMRGWVQRSYRPINVVFDGGRRVRP